MYKEGMLKENSLASKVIVITGGGSGLGKSMALYFSSLGARLIITSRNADKLRKAAADITAQTGGEVLPVSCDVRDYSQIQSMLEKAVSHFGMVNALVNNAAGNFISPTERLSPGAFDVILDIVLKGTKNTTLAFGKYWIENNISARVLNIVTTYASTGSGYVVPSAAAKAGVLAMTRSLAVEWAKYGIRFNAIAPGPFPTEGAWDRLLPGDLRKKLDPARKIPVGRVGEHRELANLAAYLISDFAAYINGEVITIDGGEWLQGAGEMNFLQNIPESMWDELEKMIRSKNKK